MASEEQHPVDYIGLSACLDDQSIDDTVILHMPDTKTDEIDTVVERAATISPDQRDSDYAAVNIFRLYSKEVNKYSLLDSEQEKQLAIRSSEGDKKARNILVESNLRLVIFYAYKFRGQGVDIMDLIQEGNLGLLYAAEKFDYKRGYRFTTYATFWIAQRMRKAVMHKNGIIKIPPYMSAKIRTVLESRATFVEENGREPDMPELAEATGFSLRVLKNVISIPSCGISLDSPVNEEGDTYMAFCVDEDALPIEDIIEREDVRKVMEAQLDKLSSKEQYIIIHSFGLMNQPIYNGAKMGRELDLTRERIRQIKRDALIKMRLDNPNLEELLI